MKKIYGKGVILAIGLFASNAMAEEYYGGVSVNYTNTGVGEGDDLAGISLALNGGMSLDDMIEIEGFSVEGEFSKSVLAPSEETGGASGGVVYSRKDSINYWNAALYAAYTFQMTETLAIKARAGLAYSSLTFEVDASCSGSSFGVNCTTLEWDDGLTEVSDSGIGLAFGASVSYAVSSDISAVLSYTRINSKISNADVTISHIGVGVAMAY